MPMRGPVLMLAPLLMAPLVAACGGGSNATPSVAPGLDPCVVGTWKSTGVHGTVSSADGSIHIPLAGGANSVAIIRRDGSLTLDYSAAEPQHGTGTDGGAYMITITGRLAGHLRAKDGQATLDFSDPSTATQTISKNGVVLQRINPPPEQVSTYTCKPGSALAVTTNGITQDWTPAPA